MKEKYTHGGDIYSQNVRLDFSANINPFGMPESVKAAAVNGVHAADSYPDRECRELIQAIHHAENLPECNILCGNGAADLIFNFVWGVKPKRALLLVPTFSEYEEALHSFDCECDYYLLKEKEEFQLTDRFFETLYQERIEILFICNPNNPTGQPIEKDLMEKILVTCEEKNIICIVDECFNNFLDNPEDYSLKHRIPFSKNLVIIKAFTKMYGMPGLRLGYCLCGDENLLSKIKEVRQPWSVSTPAQYAGIAALKETGFVENTREYINKEREFMIDELKSLQCQVFGSKANYIFFRWNEKPESLYDLFLKHQILIRKCENYHGLDNHYYRIAIKTREENREFLQVFHNIMREG